MSTGKLMEQYQSSIATAKTVQKYNPTTFSALKPHEKQSDFSLIVLLPEVTAHSEYPFDPVYASGPLQGDIGFQRPIPG